MLFCVRLISLILILFSNPLFGQQAYFVSNDGNDENEGNLINPWQTIQFGLNQLEPGDTLMIRGGEYEERCSLQVAGSGAMPILIQAYNNERVIITGNSGNDSASFTLLEMESVIIRGLEIADHASGPGIYLDRCSDILIERNKIHGNKTGIHIKNSDPSKQSRHIIVRNNFIYRNWGNALIIGPEDMESASGLIDSLVVRNNSFFENDLAQEDRGEIQVSNSHQGSFVNNIFFLNEQSLLGEVHEFFYELNFDYNAYYSLLGEEAFQIYWNGVGVNGFHSFLSQMDEEVQGFFANPLFLSVSESHPDLHLTPNSPMIGKGDSDTNFAFDERDIDGQSRVNALPDIGADEYYLQLIICSLGIFEARPQDNRVRLNWSGTCFSESGGKYLVQRSRDQEDWETIAEVQSDIAKFNTEVLYEYFDSAPLEGLSFYRTRFVDENGSFLDSNVDEVVYSGGEVLVYPNPVGDVLNIFVEDNKYVKKILIYDFSGKKKELREFSAALSMQPFPAGQYLLQMLDEQEEIKGTIRIIKF